MFNGLDSNMYGRLYMLWNAKNIFVIIIGCIVYLYF
jgi:hypothetical protein